MGCHGQSSRAKAAPQTETYGRDSPGARTIANPRRPTRARRIARRPACPDDLAASWSGPDGPRRPRSRCRTQTTQSTSAGTSTHVSRTTRSRLDQGPSDHRMLPGSVYGLLQMRLAAIDARCETNRAPPQLIPRSSTERPIAPAAERASQPAPQPSEMVRSAQDSAPSSARSWTRSVAARRAKGG
jgi:hypothetical protein